MMRKGLCAGYGALHAVGLYRPSELPVAYVIEKADWSIKWDGHYYTSGIEARHPGTVSITTNPERLFNRVVHFGSQFIWGLWAESLSPSNRAVVTYFHGKREDGPEMARHVDYFLENLKRIEKVVTAASLTERRLLEWGVPPDKLVRVPLGVDTDLFHPPTEEQRQAARERLGVPEGSLCIGSFQKDGVGWGEGLEPKLIKGPDMLVEAVARLARDFPVFVLLTGPARGYVRRGLEKHGVPYRHLLLDDYPEVAECYRALDLYLVTSREEGGPKALLESLASGVPVVSTRVGMAEDVIIDGENGALVEVGDMDEITRRAAEVLSDPNKADAWRTAGRAMAESNDWSRVSLQLYEKVYKEMLG